MKKFPIALVGALILSSGNFTQVAAEVPEVKISVAAVRLVKSGYGEGFEGLRPFQSQGNNVALSLFVSSPAMTVISISSEESRLKSFADDLGTDLLEKSDPGSFTPVGFSSMAPVSRDGAVGMIVLESGRLPAEAAKSVRAEGAISVHLGSKTAEHRASVSLKEEAALKAGPFSFTVKSVAREKNYKGEAVVTVSIETGTNPASLAGLHFVNREGREIESRRSGSSSMVFNGEGTFGFDYEIMTSEPGDVATVVFDEWTDFQRVLVPFVAEAGVATSATTGAAAEVK